MFRHRFEPMSDLLLHLASHIGGELADVVVLQCDGQLCQRIDQISGLFNLGEAASAGHAPLAIIPANRLAFAGREAAHAGPPSVSNTSIVTSPSISVISAALSLPLS